MGAGKGSTKRTNVMSNSKRRAGLVNTVLSVDHTAYPDIPKKRSLAGSHNLIRELSGMPRSATIDNHSIDINISGWSNHCEEQLCLSKSFANVYLNEKTDKGYYTPAEYSHVFTETLHDLFDYGLIEINNDEGEYSLKNYKDYAIEVTLINYSHSRLVSLINIEKNQRLSSYLESEALLHLGLTYNMGTRDAANSYQYTSCHPISIIQKLFFKAVSQNDYVLNT